MKGSDLYYIPEEEFEEVVSTQVFRKIIGVAQLVISFVLLAILACFNADTQEVPYWILVVSPILVINGIRMLKKFDFINRKYGLRIW